ncbi:Aft1 HRA domain-containing protein [Pseudoneurospora amorphoporcata]|uniref:Aft1 HRA domain-containing protein n=1 Tax=Pseudoneurospora amorphoporcata TaxID=241081 RepID=A0AAN6SJI9_9PEZI|nr:Aft1 HRA domain-containing protein [Pseudoneurospora amorphoporcata]
MGSSTGAAGRDGHPETKHEPPLKPSELTTSAEPTKPLAPPPRPAQQQSTNSPSDYFSQNPIAGSLSLEPNPFEQSFGGAPETPGGTKLPPVAALASPSSILPPGSTPFPWGGSNSLRSGPLSPAMLSGPTSSDYFGDHIRGGFPTPNESSLRTGLTPGGSGSMFPAPSPNSTLFAQLAGSAATPGTIDFHRTAISAAAAKAQAQHAAQQQQQQQQQQQSQPPSITSQPASDIPNGIPPLKPETKPPTGPFDPHDNDAANGLFMLAQGRNASQPPSQSFNVVSAPPPPPPIHPHTAPAPVKPVNTSPQMNGNASNAGSSARGVSEVSIGSDESELARPNTRGKGKRNSTGAPTTGSRRKAEDASGKAPANKKAKTNGSVSSLNGMDYSGSEDEDKPGKDDGTGPKSKMTEEEKRKNFLERNRVAALKCRQRKKQWLANLQQKVEMFSQENDALTATITQLREEVVNLKTLLLAHKDCPVTQSQGLHHGAYMQQAIEPFSHQMNPYGMGAGIPNQPVGMPPNVAPRRFS